MRGGDVGIQSFKPCVDSEKRDIVVLTAGFKRSSSKWLQLGRQASTKRQQIFTCSSMLSAKISNLN
jgi:hypothetical protein